MTGVASGAPVAKAQLDLGPTYVYRNAEIEARISIASEIAEARRFPLGAFLAHTLI